jgi:hypothetical protein
VSIKDIRSATLGQQNKFRSEKVKHGSIEVEVRQLSYADRTALIEKCTKDDKMDTLKLQVYAVIYTVVDPETGEKVFNEADYETMVQQPSGGYVDTFSKAAFKVLGLSAEEGDAEKN